jgi:Fe-S cluster assembly protein SufB
MPAVQDTIDQVRNIDVDQYKYGFESKIAMDKAPKGLSEDTIRFISAKEGRAGLDAGMASGRLSPLADA